jgi:hypothetical protein
MARTVQQYTPDPESEVDYDDEYDDEEDTPVAEKVKPTPILVQEIDQLDTPAELRIRPVLMSIAASSM